MITKEYIFQVFDALKDIDSYKTIISDFVKNKAIPEDERFEVWSKTPECLRTIDDICAYATDLNGKEVSWYDDFYVNRGQIFDCVDRLECAEKWSKEKVPLLKHIGIQLMNDGIHGFKNDW